MRALVMDFAGDSQAQVLNNEYLFGKYILVCPVTEPMYSKIGVQGNDTLIIEDFSTVKKQEVYLPKGADWIDFWTGEKLAGGKKVSKDVPVDVIPLYVKAGSVIPLGPKVQYATEKNWDNLEMRIYAGADGSFTLYEDENDNYNYEKGIYSTITFIWNDKNKTLTIGDRQGSFPGMLSERKFNIVLVSGNKGIGMDVTEAFDRTITYKGKKLVTKL
jgi:alpha-D-xyloside xylohydrolase